MKDASRRSLLTGLVALAAVALGFAACDDKPKPTDPAATTAPTTAKTAGPTTPPVSGKEYKIGWSVWTGWMPFKLMEEKGLLEKRAKEHGVKIKLVEFKGYMDSVQAYAAKKLDGCAMTSMESLQPASNGVDSIGILINDVSNGGDGVLLRGQAELKAIKGQTVLLEEFSVSHYLLGRALESVGLTEKDVKVKNIPGDEAGKAFLTDPSVTAVATWNPHLFHAVEAGKGKVVFSSRDIPNEIMDFLIVSGDALKESPALGKALADAWFDAMALITDEATRKEAIEIMAKGAGSSVEEFNKMLADTTLYTDRAKAAAFLEGDTIRATMEKVKKFSFDHDLIKDASFTIGYGSSAPDKLRFANTYVAQGK